jgi:hypothetical protein
MNQQEKANSTQPAEVTVPVDAQVRAALGIGLRAAQARMGDREMQERSAMAMALRGSTAPAPEFKGSGLLQHLRNDVEYIQKAIDAFGDGE